MHALYLTTFWTVEQKHFSVPILTLGSARKMFNITLIGKKKSHIDALSVNKT